MRGGGFFPKLRHQLRNAPVQSETAPERAVAATLFDMPVPSVSPANQTAIRIMTANAANVPLMIPGAREPRITHPGGGRADTLDQPGHAAVVAHLRAPTDFERLEYERDGGGAPGERRPAGTPRTRLARFWRWLLWPHPPRVLGA